MLARLGYLILKQLICFESHQGRQASNMLTWYSPFMKLSVILAILLSYLSLIFGKLGFILLKCRIPLMYSPSK